VIVRRVTPKAANAEQQLALLPDWRYHALVTDIPGPLLKVEAFHRDHAEVENTIKDLKHHAGLAHLPSGRFAANAVWLGLVGLAYNLGRWTLLAGKGIDCFCSTKTLRQRLIAWPARLARSGRRLTLHAPKGWPWAEAVTAMLARLCALPAPA
jgi:DDE family transposase